MKVIITRDTVADGKPVKADKKPVEISDAAAKALIAMGKAQAYTGKAAPVATPPANTPPAGKGAAQEGEGSGTGENGEGDGIEPLDLEGMSYAELEATGKEYGVTNRPKLSADKLKAAIQEAYQQKQAA